MTGAEVAARLTERLGADPTLGGAVATLTRLFRDGGLDTPALDARRLVAWASQRDGLALLREPGTPVSSAALERMAGAAARRLAREPVSRIVGFRGFHAIELEIGPATLDPRPETETLVDGVLDLVDRGEVPGHQAPRILDLGTGSGAILLALLHRLPEATGLGVDISDDALAVARRNAVRLGLDRRASFHGSDWLAIVSGTYDLVVSNPPYIPAADVAVLEPEVRQYDPLLALDGGDDGLDAYRRIAGSAGSVLRPGAWLVVEVGKGQAEAVAQILETELRCPVAPRVWTDLAGIARCVAVKARDRPIEPNPA